MASEQRPQEEGSRLWRSGGKASQAEGKASLEALRTRAVLTVQQRKAGVAAQWARNTGGHGSLRGVQQGPGLRAPASILSTRPAHGCQGGGLQRGSRHIALLSNGSSTFTEAPSPCQGSPPGPSRPACLVLARCVNGPSGTPACYPPLELCGCFPESTPKANLHFSPSALGIQPKWSLVPGSVSRHGTFL